MDRVEEMERVVATTLNKVHLTAQKDANRGRTARDPPKVGDRVWVLRPKGVGGNKILTWWVGPYKLVERVGESSFHLQIRPGIFQDVHLDQVKPYTVDEEWGIGRPLLPLVYRQNQEDHIPNRKVEKILARRLNDRGESEFLTHWEGTPDSDDTWETALTFLSACDPRWLEFCWNNNVGVEVLDALEAERELE